MRRYLLTLAFLFCFALPSAAYWQSRTQVSVSTGGPITAATLGSTANTNTGTATSIALTASAISTGDLVVVFVAWGTTASDVVTSVADASNTYTKACGAAGPGGTLNGGMDIYYKENAVAVGSPTITANFSGSVGDRWLTALRATNIITSSSLDLTTCSQVAATTTPSISTGVLNQAKELVVGAIWGNNNPTITTPGSFTRTGNVLMSDNNKAGELAYQVVSVTTSVTYNPTFSASQASNIGFATFKGN